MNVDSKLVAVVGPNESGKTSFLEALTHFNHFEPLKANGPERELTRNKDIHADQKVIEATYLVEDEEREAFKDVPESDKIRWCLISKHAESGTHYYTFKPRHPHRSLQPRQRAVRLLNGVSSRQRFARAAEDYQGSNLVAEVRNLASTLDTSLETIPEEAKEDLRSVATTLENVAHGEGPQYVRELAQLLSDLAEHEASPPLA